MFFHKNFSSQLSNRISATNLNMRSFNKAPNILILSNDQDKFTTIRIQLREILGINSFTVYNVTTTELQNSTVWMNNCRLLIDIESKTNSSIFKEFLKQGGNVLTVCTDNVYQEKENNKVDSDIPAFFRLNQVPDIDGTHYIAKTSLSECNKDTYLSFFKKVIDYVDDETPLKKMTDSEYFEAYQIFTRNSLLQSTNVIKDYLTDKLKPKMAKLLLNDPILEKEFNKKSYFETLNTNKLGQVVIFTKATQSTMNAFEMLPSSIDNVVVIAQQQTAGKGTHQNDWLSPKGCCMFTLFVKLSPDFSLSRLSLLQFAAGLASVKAVTTTENLEELPLEVKWPNDIYFSKKFKLGGVLAKTSLMGSSAFLKIGIGFNLDNEYPTGSLNRILRDRYLPTWTCEKFVAKFLNKFEMCVQQLTNPNGLENFLKEFEEIWMHSGEKIRVEHWDEDVEIIGLNEYGYLKVKKADDSIHFLQPDGNRYDMMRNLIVLRT